VWGVRTDVDWVALVPDGLPVAEALDFAGDPSCGAVVLFLGTVRDHSAGRPGVTLVEYEAWEEQVEPLLAKLAGEARSRFPGVAHVVLLHRTGPLRVRDTSVLVAVSAPHRGEAFDAARWCIDTLKETVPIWKHEHWDGGHAFGLDAKPIGTVGG
jgi:molybdopterin synthase catalytic subunit